MGNVPRPILVGGSAVQDITVGVDLDRLTRADPNIERLLRLKNKPQLRRDLVLTTRAGSQTFRAVMELTDLKVNEEDYYELEGGRKYTLREPIREGTTESNGDHNISLPCEQLSWGGGGINMVTFLRALVPNDQHVPIKYADIAMTPSLADVMPEFERLQRKIIPPTAKGRRVGKSLMSAADLLKRLNEQDPKAAEEFASGIAGAAVQYSPERSLEVFLASLLVERVLYRPKNPQTRRNWVFSDFHTADRSVEDKIVFRGPSQPLDQGEEVELRRMIEKDSSSVGAVVLNSLKDRSLFRAGLHAYKQAHGRNPEGCVGILAMTSSMLDFVEDLRNEDKKHLYPFIPVFNETEALQFANLCRKRDRLSPHKPFIEDYAPPLLQAFAEVAVTILDQFDSHQTPRIYITLGHRGSLGIDGNGHVVYVSSYTKPGSSRIYDTNACGDAYCAAITLLEWAKRSGYPQIAKVDVDPRDYRYSANEMIYFMSVATAVAYCKATNPRGRVDPTEVKDLLDHVHLATGTYEPARKLLKANSEARLRVPDEAHCVKVTPQLHKLMS